MLLIRPPPPLLRTATTLPALVTGLRIWYSSIRKALFLFHSHFQIPQCDLCAIPATCLLKDTAQIILDRWLWYLNRCCDLCVRASSGKKRCDRPFFTCEIRVSRKHLAPQSECALRASPSSLWDSDWGRCGLRFAL